VTIRCDSVETSVFESTYYWYRGLLSDAGFEHEIVSIESKLYFVACNAALLDFRLEKINPDIA
jgi:hypothetical protein